MNKKQLIQKTAEKTGFSKNEVSLLIDALIEVTADELAAGGSVLLTGFGCLEAKTRKARKGAHPRTGEPIDIPEVHTAVFRAGSALQERLNGNENDRLDISLCSFFDNDISDGQEQELK